MYLCTHSCSCREEWRFISISSVVCLFKSGTQCYALVDSLQAVDERVAYQREREVGVLTHQSLWYLVLRPMYIFLPLQLLESSKTVLLVVTTSSATLVHSYPLLSSTLSKQVVQDCAVSTQVNAVGSVVSVTPSHVSPPLSIVHGSHSLEGGSVSGSTSPFCNTNPFYIRQIGGNIRMCQGCRGSLRSASGGVPNPPFDIALARLEKRQYRDKNGDLRTPVREQPFYYHLQVSCVKTVAPCFIPSSVLVPADIHSIHKYIPPVNVWYSLVMICTRSLTVCVPPKRSLVCFYMHLNYYWHLNWQLMFSDN